MRLYRFLLRLLPGEFRARHAEEIERLFADMLHEARQKGPMSVFLLHVTTAVDLMRQAGARIGRQRIGEGWMMEVRFERVITDLRLALRGFRRAPGFAVAATVTLALGVGAITAVFSVVNGVILSPLPYPEPDRLVVVYNEYPTLDVLRGAQSPGDLADYRDQADLLTGLGSISTFPQTIIENDRPRRVEVALVTPGFFSMLGVSPQLGRDIRADDDHDVALLSHAYWQDQMGGDPDVLGATLPFSGTSKTVIGVLPPDFRLVMPSNFGVPSSPTLWTPIPAQGWGRDDRDRTAHWMNVVGRLSPGAEMGQAQDQMDAVASGQRDLLTHRAERQARIRVIPLHEEIVRDVKPALTALLGAAGMLVLIACANVANLLLVRAQRRRDEIAVRAALGGGRLTLLQQLLTEGLVLGALGSSLGLALAWIGIDWVLALDPGTLPRLDTVQMDLGVLAFVAGLAGTITLLFSVAPAWLATRHDVAVTMRDAGRSGPTRSGATLSSGLIVAELALSLVLLTGGGLLVRSFVAMTSTEPGFHSEGILTFSAPLPAARFQVPLPPGYTGRPAFNHVRKPYYDELTRVLRDLPGVQAVGGIFPAPLSGNTSGSTYATEATSGNEEGQLASSQLVTPEYFETVGIPFIEGRTFLPDEAGETLVIDRAMAERVWPGESALGKRLEIGWWSGAVWGEVVGVVENVRSHTLTEPNPPTVYRLGTVYAYSAMTMAVRAEGDPLALLEGVRTAVAGIDSEAPVIDVKLMDEYIAEQSAQTGFVLTLVGLFALLALGLAAVGLYGVISYAVGQRVREYGIRLAFGAGRAQLFGLVIRRGLILTLIGISLGVIGALGVRGLIEPFLFGVQPTDPVTLIAIVAVVGVVAFGACVAPAGRATLVDPAESLRSQ